MALVRDKIDLPLAAGERYHNKWEFKELIRNNYVNYIRPDILHCGGITEMKKIAALVIEVISHIDDDAVQKKAAGEVAEMCARFPVPGIDD